MHTTSSFSVFFLIFMYMILICPQGGDPALHSHIVAHLHAQRSIESKISAAGANVDRILALLQAPLLHDHIPNT